MGYNYSKYIALVFFGLMILTAGFSQEKKLERAAKEYDKLAFISASEIYEEVAEKGYKSVELFEKLGNTYYFNARYTEASKWYGELFAMGEPVTAVYYLRYAQTLKAVGEDDKAKEFFDKYTEMSGVTKEGFKNTSDYMKIIENNSGRYDIQNLPINTDGIDFGSTINKDKLIFSSTRDTGTVVKRTSAWDGLTFLDLYEVTESEGEYGEVRKLKGEVNTRFHESSACITQDGKTMYFTRNNTTSGMVKGKETPQHLKIYRATMKDGKWTDIEDLSINGDLFSTAHPALSPEEDKLYFVSDRPESMGATDIFMATISSDGVLGKVENMGEKINTSGRESFPFITVRNELYFSSDGHFGLGGYDIFYTQLKKEGHGSLINIGKPINSEMDDFAFTIDTETRKGYVSSNRAGGMGFDDIYGFTENRDIRDLLKKRIHGQVIDQSTKVPLARATLTLYNDETGLADFTTTTDSTGNFTIEAERFVPYRIRATKEKYSIEEIQISGENQEEEINFVLEQNEYELQKDEDLAKMLNIREIYFDFDEWTIREDAEVELQKVVVAMETHPLLKIDIRSHTDSRGNDVYNMVLSERRAKSTMQYLISKGIDPNRLKAKGYGESELVNGCANGVKCSEQQHLQNRRSEFVILEQ